MLRKILGTTPLFVTFAAVSALALPAAASAAQPGSQGANSSTAPSLKTATAERTAAASAILFDDKNFSDNGPSQGVSGAGCKNLARPKVTSSIRTDARLKLWDGRNCTGASKVINRDIADLATIGFDNRTVSVRFL